MKIVNKYTLRLLATAALVVGFAFAGVSCRRSVTVVGNEQRNIVFSAQIGAQQGIDSKLTPSDITNGGKFEVDDSVGIYLFDQKAGAVDAGYSYINTPYVAALDNERVVFGPVDGQGSVYYKTYYLHNLYAYYPYSAVNDSPATAKVMSVSVKTDQTQAKDYVLSDFLTCRLLNIKPQQIDPAAPELVMSFAHQFSSVVVKVRNGDNSAIKPTPVVSIVNMATDATADITQVTPAYSALKNPVPVVMQQNVAYTNVNFPNQRCYKGIIIPQQFTEGKSMIKVKVGTGTTARVYEYAPTTTDPIFAAGGFVQGKEHVLDFVISGTELLVQGGEIVEWGTGSKSVSEINGGGQSASKMIFEIANDNGGAETKIASFKSAVITIDGKERTTIKLEYNALVVPSIVTCNYYQGNDWGYDFEKIVFKDANGLVLMTCTPLSPIRIKGNPLNDNYATVIAVVDAQSGTIKAK